MNKALDLESNGEPPSKKARHLTEKKSPRKVQHAGEKDNAQKRRFSRGKKSDTEKTPERPRRVPEPRKHASPVQEKKDQAPSDVESDLEGQSLLEENNDDDAASINGDPDGYGYAVLFFGFWLTTFRYESPTAHIPAEMQNFPLSKERLSKSNIVYSDEYTLCVRISEKMVRQWKISRKKAHWTDTI